MPDKFEQARKAERLNYHVTTIAHASMMLLSAIALMGILFEFYAVAAILLLAVAALGMLAKWQPQPFKLKWYDDGEKKPE